MRKGNQHAIGKKRKKNGINKKRKKNSQKNYFKK